MRGRLRTAIPNTDHLTRFTKYNALLAKVNLLKTRCIENSDAMTFLITLLTESSQVKLLGLVLASVTNTEINSYPFVCQQFVMTSHNYSHNSSIVITYNISKFGFVNFSFFLASAKDRLDE